MGGEASGLQLWDIATQQPLGSELTTSDEKTGTLAFSADGAMRAARTCRSSGTRSIHLGRPRRCAHGWEATTGRGRSGRRTYRTRRTGRCAADELTAPMERSTTRRHRRRGRPPGPVFTVRPYPYEFSSTATLGPQLSLRAGQFRAWGAGHSAAPVGRGKGGSDEASAAGDREWRPQS